MIIDCHSHIASPMVLPPQWSEGWIKNTISALPEEHTKMGGKQIRKLFDYLTHDHDTSHLLKQMEVAGIEKTTLLIIDWGLTYPDWSYTIEEVTDYHYHLMKVHPNRFRVFAGIDPRRGKKGQELFEKCLRDYGFHGLKLYPPCGYSPSDESLFPFYELCAKYGVPVLTHIGPSAPSLRAQFALPIEVDTAAWKFPEVDFILAHGAHTYPYDCRLLAANRDNIYLDLSGYQTLTDDQLDQILTEHLQMRLGKKLLFGTDWPIHFFAGPQQNAIKKINGILERNVVDQRTFDQIMYMNYEQLLNKHGRD